MTDVSLELVQSLIERGLSEHAATRREMADMRTLLLGLNDKVNRLDRKVDEMRREMHEVKDDIELMLKAELMGRMGNFETRIEASIEELTSRLPPE
jgi:hypothetical protein